MIIKLARLFHLTVLFLLLSACAHTEPKKAFEPIEEGNLSLIVNIEGIKCCDGVLRLALYNHADYWLSKTDLARGRLGFIVADSQTIELHGLPEGQYALAVYQDLDSDNKLDRLFGLIPKEPYGFSNNVGRYGPVSFNKAMFDLNESKTISIKLNTL